LGSAYVEIDMVPPGLVIYSIKLIYNTIKNANTKNKVKLDVKCLTLIYFDFIVLNIHLGFQFIVTNLKLSRKKHITLLMFSFNLNQ